MRSFRSSAIILTLFMLLLVAAAAFAFLLQGDLRLRNQVLETQAEADLVRQLQAQTELQLGAAEATRDAFSTMLATAENNGVLLEAQLVESQQEINETETRVAELEEQLATSAAAVATLEESAQNQPPVVAIVAPQDRALLPPGESVSISIVASAPTGLDSVQVQIEGNAPINYTDIGGQTLYTRTDSWETPGQGGEYAITVIATNSSGATSEESITVIISDVGTPTPTPSGTTTP
jgi:hypothetical protein